MADVTYTDAQIAALIGERKRLPAGWRVRMRPRPKRGHRDAALVIVGDAENEFRLITRQSVHDHLNFSVIPGVRDQRSRRIFRLLRYNGRSHLHTNSIEGDRFFDFHIHRATERYQEKGQSEETYAVTTDQYCDLHGALACMIADAGFEDPEPQLV